MLSENTGIQNPTWALEHPRTKTSTFERFQLIKFQKKKNLGKISLLIIYSSLWLPDIADFNLCVMDAKLTKCV